MAVGVLWSAWLVRGLRRMWWDLAEHDFEAALIVLVSWQSHLGFGDTPSSSSLGSIAELAWPQLSALEPVFRN